MVTNFKHHKHNKNIDKKTLYGYVYVGLNKIFKLIQENKKELKIESWPDGLVG